MNSQLPQGYLRSADLKQFFREVFSIAQPRVGVSEDIAISAREQHLSVTESFVLLLDVEGTTS
jgi:hypothetical protein